MDYEKKYKDLVAKLREARNDDGVNDDRFGVVLDGIFPELAESEDERIRKAIISFLEQSGYGGVGEYPKAKMIAWLEKQKVYPDTTARIPQKPAEWSEEDLGEAIFNWLYENGHRGWDKHDTICLSSNTITKLVKHFAMPTSWKPSEEQIKDLQRMIDVIEEEWGGEESGGRDLLDDLKKL